MEHIQRETNKTPRLLPTEQIQRKYKRLARLDEVFASGDKVIALAIRKTERTKLCAEFIPSQIFTKNPNACAVLLHQFWGCSDGLWPPVHKIKQLFLD